MALPVIHLPQINLPFDLPSLLHPAVVHFVIAIPVVIFLMEFYNLFTRRKSIGAFSFILLLITVGMLALAYLTGTVDGKEAYDLLAQDGQAALKAHKILSVYVLITAVAVLFFKLLAMTGKGFFRFLYFIFLIGLIAITFKQGKDGGELVYEYGANVERVDTLKDDLNDAKDALEELSKETTEATVSAPVVEKVTKEIEAPKEHVIENAEAVPVVSGEASIETKSLEVEESTTTVATEPVSEEKPAAEENVSNEALQNAINEVRTAQ